MKKKDAKQKPVQEDKPNKATFHPGSTTQGGSNFGQGSSHLGNKSIQQGSHKSEGSNYDNEKDWDKERLRTNENDNS